MSHHDTAASRNDSSGFTLVELMLVIAIVGVLAALAAGGVLRARVAANEASAVASVRTVNNAQNSYASTCARGGYAQSLDDLSLEPLDGVPFIAPDLAADGITKSGYRFAIDDGVDTSMVVEADGTCSASADDALATYYVHAEPIFVGFTGQRSFGSDDRGTIFQQLDGEEVGNAFASAIPLR
jgi:prepilin-type N-terminal cleavage/methylation domain-containing protein